MTVLLIYLAIMATLALIGLIGAWLIDRWTESMTKRMGLWGAFIAMGTLFVLGTMLFPTFCAFALTVTGTTLAVLFSIPILFGLPGWTILPYGGVLGLMAYVALTKRNRKKVEALDRV